MASHKRHLQKQPCNNHHLKLVINLLVQREIVRICDWASENGPSGHKLHLIIK